VCVCVCVCVYSAPDKPRIDSIATGDSSALVHFETSEHRPPINPGTEFYVESALESDAGTALLHVIRAVFKLGSLRVQPPPEMLRRNFFWQCKKYSRLAFCVFTIMMPGKAIWRL